MWLMMNADEADDYVIATGETHSVREFLEKTFSYLDLDWERYVEIDPRYFRPAEVDLLLVIPVKPAPTRLGTESHFRWAGQAETDYDLELANTKPPRAN